MASARHARAAKAQLPSLEGGPVRLSVIREQARKHLLDAIDSKRGKKALVLDPTISGPLSLLDVNLSEVLSEHGVIKVMHLECKLLDDPAYNQGEPRLIDTRTITYIVRATVENAQLVAAQIKAVASSGAHDFAIFFVPRRTTACDKVLEEAGVLADATRGELPLDAFPLDDDVLSLELPAAFRDCVLDGDTAPLHHTARALTQLQRHFGLVPRLQGKGLAAESVRKILLQMRRDGQATIEAHGAPKIHRMVLIDRDIDTATPMCTQITLEGLVDEVAGIKCATVPWNPRGDRRGDSSDGAASSSGASTSSAAAGRGSKGSIMLNSTDPYWQEFRDLPYYIASQRLQQYARDARKEYSELGSKDISDLKMFVKGLPRVMLLDRISDVAAPVAEVVKQQLFHDRLRHEQDILDNYELEASVDFVQELMCRGAGVVEVLRLLVLLGIANNGIPRRHFDTLRSQLLQTYGHHHLPTLTSLEKCGLLKVQTGGKGAWGTIRKSFNLLAGDDEQPAVGQAPSSIAHLYKGYAPLSIRFLEHALKGTWASVSEGLFLLAPVTHFDVWQATDEHGAPVEKPYKASTAGAGGGGTGASGSSGAGTSAGPAAASGSGGQTGANGAAAAAADFAGMKQEVVAVVFIGGATFSEISALRLLSTLPGYQHFRFLAVTTSVINGRTLLGTFADQTLQGFAD